MGYNRENFQGPGICAACNSGRRARIDAHLLNKYTGADEALSLRELSRYTGISKSALWLHRVRCLGVPLIQKARIRRRAQAQEVVYG